MNHIFRKLKSKTGESLVESMAAILVFTFASIIMLSMVSSGANINTTAKDADRAHQQQMAFVERGNIQDTHSSGYVTFTFNALSETIPVDVFQAEEDALYAYYASPTSPTTEEDGTE